MNDRQYSEKDEKEMRKHEEKSAEEKWRRDPISALVWACILIWAGLVLLADNLGLFESLFAGLFPEPADLPIDIGAWPLIFVGAGVILLGEVAVRLLIPEYRAPVTGTIFFAIILIGIGLGNVISWSLIWPLALIAAGIAALIRVLFGDRSR